MCNLRNNSRWNFVDPSYADLPQPIHWLLNFLGAVGMVLPYLTVFLPCLAVIWGADQLQSVLGMALDGASSTLFAIAKTGVAICSVGMLLSSYSARRDWEDELRRTIRDACEEFFKPWLR
jgi:ABC-type Fe3+ transport system permease subunit